MLPKKCIAEILPSGLLQQKACLPRVPWEADTDASGTLALICNCPACQLLRKEEPLSHRASQSSTSVWLPRGQSGTDRRLRFCSCLWQCFPTWPWELLPPLVSLSPFLHGHHNSPESRDNQKQTAKNNPISLIKGKKYCCFLTIQTWLCNSVGIASFLSLWQNCQDTAWYRLLWSAFVRLTHLFRPAFL